MTTIRFNNSTKLPYFQCVIVLTTFEIYQFFPFCRQQHSLNNIFFVSFSGVVNLFRCDCFSLPVKVRMWFVVNPCLLIVIRCFAVRFVLPVKVRIGCICENYRFLLRIVSSRQDFIGLIVFRPDLRFMVPPCSFLLPVKMKGCFVQFSPFVMIAFRQPEKDKSNLMQRINIKTLSILKSE